MVRPKMMNLCVLFALAPSLHTFVSYNLYTICLITRHHSLSGVFFYPLIDHRSFYRVITHSLIKLSTYWAYQVFLWTFLRSFDLSVSVACSTPAIDGVTRYMIKRHISPIAYFLRHIPSMKILFSRCLDHIVSLSLYVTLFSLALPVENSPTFITLSSLLSTVYFIN
jgi:hypothetical protein